MRTEQRFPVIQTVPSHITDSDDREFDWLVCPLCARPLRVLSQVLECPACRENWPVVNGVPRFVEGFSYWGEIPLLQMREVNRRAAVSSWRSALLDSTEPSVQKAAEMILNTERANWHYMLNLPAASRILDIGAGTGTNSHALAMRFDEVVALEPVEERIEFMRHRFAQEQLSKVKIVQSSLWKLPFPEKSFDVVVMNGVLEWVAEGQSGDPGEIQLRALRKMLSLLKPGGFLYVGIENRMCPEFLVGYLDPHCRMPYVTILPRPIAHWYARRKGKLNGYRNYIYSSWGYRRLLRRAGFTEVDAYVALPSYNHPRAFVPLKNNVFEYYCRNFNPVQGSGLRRVTYELLLRVGLLKHMEDSFVLLARR